MFKLVGDNIDKAIKPRAMWIDSQSRSLHYFQSYAVRDRIDVSHLDEKLPTHCTEGKDVTLLLPSKQEQKTVMGLFGVHVAKVLKKCMPFFEKFGKGLEKHLKHVYYREMSQKSEVMSMAAVMYEVNYTVYYVSVVLHYYIIRIILVFCMHDCIFKVPLGVILKNETNTEDMVSVLESLHAYVPTTIIEDSEEVPGYDTHFSVTKDEAKYRFTHKWLAAFI